MSTKNGTPSAGEQAIIDALGVLQRTFEETQLRLERTLGAVQLHGALPTPVGTGGTTRPATSTGSLVGWSLRNTGGAAATVIIRNGPDANAPALASLTIPVGDSRRAWFGPAGVAYTEGLFFDLTGTVEGSVYLRAGE